MATSRKLKSASLKPRRTKAAAARRFVKLTRCRARLLLEFTPGIRSALKHFVPEAVADEFCDGMERQLRDLIRNPHASLR